MRQLTDTAAEKQEIKKQQRAVKKRLIRLGVIVIICIGVRIYKKDPPKFVAPDHSNKQTVYLPGILETMPEAEKANLPAAELAKYQEADRLVQEDTTLGTGWEPIEYVREEAPSEISPELEAYRDRLFKYAKKRRKTEILREQMLIEEKFVKKELILFKRSGYITAGSTFRKKKELHIRINNSMRMVYPLHLVRTVFSDSREWEEPIPKGFVKVKPAKGVTMVVKKRTATRLSKRVS